MVFLLIFYSHISGSFDHASCPGKIEYATCINHWTRLHKPTSTVFDLIELGIQGKVCHAERTSPSAFKLYFLPVDKTVNTSSTISTSTSSPVVSSSHMRQSVSTGYSSPLQRKSISISLLPRRECNCSFIPKDSCQRFNIETSKVNFTQ